MLNAVSSSDNSMAQRSGSEVLVRAATTRYNGQTVRVATAGQSPQT